MAECIIGAKCRDFVILAVDATRSLSRVILAKDDEDKTYNLTKNMVMAVIGDAGDATQFAEYIVKNIQLYRIKNGYEMSPGAAAHFTSFNLSKSLRSRNPYNVNMLMGGCDKEGPSLFHMDYLGALVPIPYAAMGIGGYFSLAIMDRFHNEDLTEEEAYELMRKCVNQVQKRLVLNLPTFKVVVVDKNGTRHLPNITIRSFNDEE